MVFLVGATASGKTETAIALGRRHDIEIVNADSRQVYTLMDIGTAKPSAAEQAQIPHHLIDVVRPDESFSLATFLQQARSTIADIHRRGRLPVVVGGTGQYLWGLLDGWELPEAPPQFKLRSRLYDEAKKFGPQALHEKLFEVDASAASDIHPNNVRRVVRALEVWELTGQQFSAQRKKAPPNFKSFVYGIWVGRKQLHHKIDQRIDSMIKNGWVDEVKMLLTSGYMAELPSFSSAGYREIAAYLHGTISWQDAIDGTQKAVHRLARQQGNWFRQSDPNVRWVNQVEEIVDAVSLLMRSGVIKSAT